MAFDGQVVSSGHQGLRSRLAVPAGPQGMLKHAGLQMPDKVARVAAAAAVWREEWQLACQSGGRTASTSRRAKGKVKFCCVRKCDFFAIGWNQSLLPDDVPMQSPRSTAHTRAMCVIWPLQDGMELLLCCAAESSAS